MLSSDPAQLKRAEEMARAKLARLAQDLDPTEWGWLAALAAERRLGLSTLAKLGAPSDFVQRLLQDGVVVARGPVRPWSIATAGLSEQSWGLADDLRQLVLRHAQALGVLGPATLKTEELLASRSEGRLVRSLHHGSVGFKLEHPCPPEMREALYEMVLFPFDATWLCATFRERSDAVLWHVLSHALEHQLPCPMLVGWLGASYAPGAVPALDAALAAHALLQGRDQDALARAGHLDAATSNALLGLCHLIRGDLEPARLALTRSTRAKTTGKRSPHALTPLVALLVGVQFVGQDGPALAARSLRHPHASTRQKATAKALQTLLRHRSEDPSRLPRPDPYQCSSEASAWELLFLGFSAFCSPQPATTRAAWALRLVQGGAAWAEAGYDWLGRQALVLAQALDAEQTSRAREELGHRYSLGNLTPLSSDLLPLVRPRQLWEEQLLVLQELAPVVARPRTKHQLDWVVDAATGNVHQPILFEYEAPSGWARHGRVSFDDLPRLRCDLPVEDQRALDVIADCAHTPACDGAHPSFPHLELLEALIDHPRVEDATEAATPLSIRRGACEVVTQDGSDSLILSLSPRSCAVGLNLVRTSASELRVVRVPEDWQPLLDALRVDVVVPHEQAPRALEVLARLGAGINVRSPHLGTNQERAADANLIVRLRPDSGAFWLELGVRPFGPEGRFFYPCQGPTVLTRNVAGQRQRLVRDVALEQRALAQLLEGCSLLLQTETDAPGVQRWLLSLDNTLTFLSQLRATGSVRVEWPEGGQLVVGSEARSQSLTGTLRAKKGWYLLRGQVPLDSVTQVGLEQLCRLPATSSGRFVRLPEGDFVALDARLARIIAHLRGAPRESGGLGLRLATSHLLCLGSELAHTGLSLDEKVDALGHEWDTATETRVALPPGFRGQLRPYQEEGFQFLQRMARYGLGACLADDMGLGKTVQLLAALLARPHGSWHLVVAPTSVCTNWQREAARFAPELRVVSYEGSQRDQWLPTSSSAADTPHSGPSPQSILVVTSYAVLAQSVERLASQVWDTVILDEAQAIKNPLSQRARAAYRLQAVARFAATGTPIENHLGDLWGIFRFLNPELLGSLKAFQTHFQKPIERSDSKTHQGTLLALVRPFLLRRTKSEVLAELPDRIHVRRALHLSDDEALRYASLRRTISEKLRGGAGGASNTFQVLAEITRLRRFCCHPRLVFPDAPADCAKLRALVPLLEELVQNGRRALIFSQYVDFLHYVRERLSEHGLSYEYLDGRTSRADRQAAVDRFQEGQSPLFVMSLKAGGLGLNLTAADTVIHLDPWWNPAVREQATDRAHRMGQLRKVTVIEFVTQDTIEEDILELHRTKLELSQSILPQQQEPAAWDSAQLTHWLQEALEARLELGIG